MTKKSKIAVGALVLVGVFSTAVVLAHSSKSGVKKNNTTVEASKASKIEKSDQLSDTRINSLIETLHQQIAEFDETFDSFFNDKFFDNSMNPLKDMENFRNTLRSEFHKMDFGKDLKFSDHIFDAWFNQRFGGNFGDIQKKEDKQFVYYEFKVDDPAKYNFTARVHNGMIQLTAEDKTMTQTEKKGYESETINDNEIERSFPLPKKVNAKKFKTAIKGNLYIVKFPKVT